MIANLYEFPLPTVYHRSRPAASPVTPARMPPILAYGRHSARNEERALRLCCTALGRAALGTGFTFGMTALGAAMVFFLTGEPRPRFRRTLLGFAAGVMTAASVWSLLLPAMDRAAAADVPPALPAAVGMLAGVVFLGALDALLPRLRRLPEGRRLAAERAAGDRHHPPQRAGGHGGGAGLRPGAGGRGAGRRPRHWPWASASRTFRRGPPWPCPCGRADGPGGGPSLGGALSGAVEPVFGILAAALAAGAEPAMPWLLSFAAGAMLYVVVEELVPQAHSRSGTCGFVIGFLTMMVLDVALG